MVALHREHFDAQPLASPPRITDVLAEMAARLPAWHLDANCRNADPDIFFVERGQSTAEAKTLCGGCPVRRECLDYALAEKIELGVFGGLRPSERRSVRTATNG